MPSRSSVSSLLIVATGLTLSAVAAPAESQEPAQAVRTGALGVFLDCNTWSCDSRYFRTEITFVNWARDRTLADVHLIVTAVQTGGGGRQFSLDFIGLGDLEGTDDTLTYTSLSTDTEAEILDGLTRVMAAGLARYAALAGRAGDFLIESTAADAPPIDELVSPEEVDDPWNFWVFELGAGFDIEGEETENEESFDGRLEARRTTDLWKVELQGNGRFSRSERELSDSTKVVDERTNWNANLLIVYSLTDRWSVGTTAGAGASTSRNQKFGADAFAAVEYSFTPYVEAPRRSVAARYEVGVQYFDWEEETIFRETAETRPQHVARFDVFQRQPWGETRASIRGAQYLHDLDLWSLRLDGNLEFRILRGLSLDIRGEVEWIEDQLYISAEGLTDQEILLGRFDRPTDYAYELSVGLSFEFGSIFNNVVNNRF